jgi:peptide/nickel transport system substrate-binding protein
MKKILVSVVMLLLITITVIGCGTPAAPATPSPAPAPSPAPVPAPKPAPAPTPVSGGILKILYTGGATNFGDPSSMNTPTDNMYAGPAMEGLVRIDPAGNLAPWLATSWTIAPDGMSITFTLRQGVKFHDGTDFNADTAKASLDVSRAGAWPQFKPVKSIDVVDPYTVRLNFAKSFDWSVIGALGRLLTGWIFSPTALQSHDKIWLSTHPVGTGPFRFVSYSKDVSIKYEKNPDYWQKGKPYLDGLEFDMTADTDTALMAYKTGMAQVLYVVQPKDVEGLKSSGMQIISVPASAIPIDTDSANPDSPFANIKVRQALDYAINKKAIAQALGYGYYEAVNQPWPSTYYAYDPSVQGYPYDPAKAKQLLTETGYANGFKTQLTIQQGAPTNTAVAVQADLKAIGIDVEIQPVTLPMISSLFSSTGWKGMMMAQAGMPLPGLDPGTMLKSHPISFGFTTISSKRETDVDDLLTKANAETDIQKRITMIQQLSKLMIDKYAMYCYIYSPPGLTAAYPQVHDLDIGISPWANFGSTWLSK